MSKKIIFLLLISIILLAGCKSTNDQSKKTPIVKDVVTTSPKATTNVIVEGKDTIPNTSVKLPPLTSTEKTKITDNINSVVDSIDGVLNTEDEAKELDLN